MKYRKDKGLAFLINATDKIIMNNFVRKLKNNGINITFEQFTILTMLWDNENLCQYNLAQLTNRDQASTSRLINTLIKNELIIRQCCPSDKRINRIKLTEKGELLKEPVESIARECFEEAVNGISKEEIEQGMKFLTKIAENLNNINSK
ncbi:MULTISPECIES: MarR family winged helix-turn-helix transcriptional regulator [Paraclostridium]|uniref:MarR family winged helix-turn-helix transcriptional regulator n=1 Tax=Paraclostridium TaxID=1849822 RepID=UPI001243311F|nr:MULTISPECIES: MarR family transcriptional regulator [Paraclostridium]MBZ6006811.1 MarR family transcriptional regulator [Paraclostridium bifermentans]MCR1876910.1 MarR family transcriptional regulator [Paraclostridium bifermentans]MDU0295928.1 MarR family transcriptional regulator [Paraclostridium sp. MRS3W1]MDV8113892.1 MarR family transcriptional regulator [Bacillus sp. BAU-SS-2023]